VYLPLGFSYQQGSTTGAITSEPSIRNSEGLSVSWEGPGQVAGGGSATFHFGVVAPAALGNYRAGATAGVDAPNTLDSQSDPEIVVVNAPPAPAPAASPQPSSAPPAQGSSTPPAQSPPATTQAAPPPPPPVFQQDADAETVSGNVLVRLPGTTDFVPLTSAMQVGFGAEIDATNGRVALTTVDADGTTYHADFYEGRFLLTRQLANGITVLQLSGSSFKSCKSSAKRTLASFDKKKPQKKAKVSKKVVRHLWGSGKGKFRTRGRYVAATVHGTTWLTEDRCDGTRAFVQEGVVDVRDLVKHKTIQLGAGQSYVARPGH
jgi:hypothetical protein